MLPLQIRVHHSNDGFIAGKITHNRRNELQSQPAAGMNAPVTGNDLVSLIFLDSRNNRRLDPDLLDAVHQLLHTLVIQHLERMPRKLVNVFQRNHTDLFFLRLVL